MSYENEISKRRTENRKLLKELGILSTIHDGSHQSLSSKQSPGMSSNSRKHAYKKTPYLEPTRRSNRIKKVEPPKFDLDSIGNIEDNLEISPVKKEKVKRENVFGAIPGVSVGTEFLTRLEASAAGIHRPTVAGIHGNPSLGCYSLALSGGYEDDVDLGDSFIYTGEGGRDLKGTKANPKNLRTAPQSKDQVLERGNLALTMNIQNNVPVRVLRGYKLRSKYAPTEGYRYDGLYDVTEYYITKGLSGFNVYKFRLVRRENQDPAPWCDDFENTKEKTPPKAVECAQLSYKISTSDYVRGSKMQKQDSKTEEQHNNEIENQQNNDIEDQQNNDIENQQNNGQNSTKKKTPPKAGIYAYRSYKISTIDYVISNKMQQQESKTEDQQNEIENQENNGQQNSKSTKRKTPPNAVEYAQRSCKISCFDHNIRSKMQQQDSETENHQDSETENHQDSETENHQDSETENHQDNEAENQ